jgi:hypothetical protein
VVTNRAWTAYRLLGRWLSRCAEPQKDRPSPPAWYTGAAPEDARLLRASSCWRVGAPARVCRPPLTRHSRCRPIGQQSAETERSIGKINVACVRPRSTRARSRRTSPWPHPGWRRTRGLGSFGATIAPVIVHIQGWSCGNDRTGLTGLRGMTPERRYDQDVPATRPKSGPIFLITRLLVRA